MTRPAPEPKKKRLALIADGLAGSGQLRMYLLAASEQQVDRILKDLVAGSPDVIETVEPAGADEESLKSLHATMFRCLDWLNPGAPRARLTARELQCLEACANGKTYWETGKILGISERTVIFHMQSVREKLDAATNAQAVAKAVRSGVV